MKSFAIVVVHYGSNKDTLACLRSIKKIKTKTAVIVVDNGTQTITSNQLTSILPQTVLIKNKTNKGFSFGVNTGVHHALKQQTDYILVLNNDVIVENNILEELQKPFQNPKVGITGCMIVYKNDVRKIWFAGGVLHTLFGITRHPYMNKLVTDTQARKNRIVDFITGSAMMVKREVFEQIGYFSEDYFMYWEDVDFCYRAIKKNYLCYYVGKPLVHHAVSASSGVTGTNKLTPIRAYYYARNPFVFANRNNILPLGLLPGQLLIRLPYYFFSVENLYAAKMYIKGVRDGIKEFYKT